MASVVSPAEDTPPAIDPAPAVSVDSVCKRFNGRTVVDGVSFTLRRGETFGLVGPNGSGKTTTIRMLLDIIRPDAGAIAVFGGALTNASKDRIGYLPEERGLYRSVTVEQTLIYLATLKGMTRRAARPRLEELLRHIGLWEHRRKKVGELSRGMSQLIGFCAAIQHRPDLLILDEPFSGLDPLNVKLMKEMIVAFGSAGATIIFSTHQMEDVEELCERVLMIYQGARVLYGDLAEIKARYRGNAIRLDYEGRLGPLPGVEQVIPRGRSSAELLLGPGQSPQAVLRELARDGVSVTRFELATPTLNEIFIHVAESGRVRAGGPG